jgi:thiamine pyrophosphokinase|nr:thiamine diphosphokinase [uncultured Lachnoclostridium sp.]
MKALIIAGGDFFPEVAMKTLEEDSFDMIIAIDNGLSYLHELGITPTHIVGDFDTVSKELLQEYQKDSKVKIVSLCPEKDATDTEVAVDLAVEEGCMEIFILGATGGRFDHTLANLHMLYRLLCRGIKAYLIDKNNKIYLIKNSTTLIAKKVRACYVSLLPFTEEVTELTLTGFKYPLNRFHLTQGTSIGISNEIIEVKAEIQFDKGILIVVESKDS